LIFDQFEELFNLYPENWQEQQIEFFKQIAESLDENKLLRIVLIIREDYIAQLDPFKDTLPEKLRHRYRLEKLNEEAAISAIKKPLEKSIDSSKVDEYNNEIHKIIEDLLKIRIETIGKNSRKTEEVKGNFIEPIHLQVVCQRWWNERFANKKDQSTTNKDLQSLIDVDKALEDFYDDAIHEAKKYGNASEDMIREFCEKKLITSNGTKGIVYQDDKVTEGLPNKIIDILESKYLIRREIRAGGIWYELTHDRLIKPIKESNKKWRYKKEKEKEKALEEAQTKIKRLHHNLKIIIPIVAVILITSSLIIIGHGWFDKPSNICSPSSIPIFKGKNQSSSTIEQGLFSISYNPDTSTIYVPNTYDNTVSVINCEKSSKQTTHNINIPLGIDPVSTSANNRTNMVYVANYNDNTVSVMDGSTNKVLDIINIGVNPVKVTINPKTNMVYVANKHSNTVSVMDGSTNKVVGTITVGNSPIDIAVNQDTNLVYVANQNDNTVSVMDGSTNKEVSIISVGNSPKWIVVNPNTNMVYIVNSNDKTISIIEGV
jgi:YVTN family beta-propeller protein